MFRHYSTYAIEYCGNKSCTLTKCINNTGFLKNETPLHVLCSFIYILIRSPWLHFPTIGHHLECASKQSTVSFELENRFGQFLAAFCER